MSVYGKLMFFSVMIFLLAIVFALNNSQIAAYVLGFGAISLWAYAFAKSQNDSAK